MQSFSLPKKSGPQPFFVYDPHKNRNSKEIRLFYHKIGSTLRVLEERIHHVNWEELYIGLPKE